MRLTSKKRLPSLSVFTLFRILFKRPSRSRADPAVSIQSEFEVDQVDQVRLARYAALLGTDAKSVPLTVHYLLAQHAQLGTMLMDDFRFRIVGMVHVENALVEYRTMDRVTPIVLSTSVRVGPRTRSGARFCTFETIGRQGQLPVFSCTSKYLAERGAGAATGKKAGPADVDNVLVAQWQVGRSDGRRYASVSGDWNPIHLTRWTARLMGLRSPIIHGMYLLAKATTQIETKTGRRVVKIDVQFKSSVSLGDIVELRLDAMGRTFALWCNGRMAVSGCYEFQVAQHVEISLGTK